VELPRVGGRAGANWKDRLHIVLSDIRMPGGSGLAFAVYEGESRRIVFPADDGAAGSGHGGGRVNPARTVCVRTTICGAVAPGGGRVSESLSEKEAGTLRRNCAADGLTTSSGQSPNMKPSST